MRPRLLNFASAVSLLLCAATLVLWVRSNWVEDFVVWQAGSRAAAIASSQQRFGLLLAQLKFSEEQPRFQYRSVRPPSGFNNLGQPNSLLRKLGFSYEAVTDPADSLGIIQSRTLTIPYWFALGVFLVLPVRRWWVWRVRSHRDDNGPLCHNCSYNLKGNASGICPECGAPTSKEEVATWHRSNA